MKSSYNVTVALFCGALGISFAACASSSDNPTSGGTAGQTAVGSAGASGAVAGASNNGTAGSSVGTGGSTGVAGAGTGTGTAGTGTGAGGFNTGLGGASAGTAGAAGAATGAGGAPAMSCGTLTPVAGDPTCCVAAGTATDLAIDDFEDGDNVIKPIGQRQGYWYTYGTDPTQTPAPASAGGKTFVPAAGGHSPLFSGLTMGSVPANAPPVYNQAGLGVGFNNHFNKSCPYNASAYKGITFWAKGTVPIKVQVSTPDSVPMATGSAGTCPTTGMCYDPYFITAAPIPDGVTWKQFTITFADKTTFAPNASTAAFEQAKILDLQFQIDGVAIGATPYNFAIDDVAFF